MSCLMMCKITQGNLLSNIQAVLSVPGHFGPSRILLYVVAIAFILLQCLTRYVAAVASIPGNDHPDTLQRLPQNVHVRPETCRN
jgi:hypothetical protein